MMRTRSGYRAAVALLPAPWPDLLSRRPGVSIPLWTGRGTVRWEGRDIAGPAQVQFRLHPSPRVHWRFACNDYALGLEQPAGDDFILPTKSSVPVPGARRLWGPSSPGKQYRVSVEGRLNVREFGDPAELHMVVIGVLNFTARIHRWAHDGEESRELIAMDVGPWRIRMIGRLTQLARNGWWRPDEGGSALTHAIDVRRADGATFAADDTEPLREALFHVLSLANGSLVGLTLPMGYAADDDQPTWIRWDQTVSEGLMSRLTWFDANAADDLGPLVEGYMALATNDFWIQLMRRAVRMQVAANQPHPIDQAIPVAMSGLELLAWVQQPVAPPVQLAPGDVTAADLIRGLLTWASISTTIAPELVHLQGYAAKSGRDLPSAMSGVRNRLIHPPRTHGKSEWPSTDLMIDAWRGAMECLDLVLLKMLGHHGNYVHRRHLVPYTDGDTVAVPWPSPPPPDPTPAPPRKAR